MLWYHTIKITESKASGNLQFSSRLLWSERKSGNGLFIIRPSRMARWKTVCWHLCFHSELYCIPSTYRNEHETKRVVCCITSHPLDLHKLAIFENSEVKTQISKKYLKSNNSLIHLLDTTVATKKFLKNWEYNCKCREIFLLQRNYQTNGEFCCCCLVKTKLYLTLLHIYWS